MTEKQKSLIRRMKRLFTECKKHDICFTAMDSQLLYFVGDYASKCGKFDVGRTPYDEVAESYAAGHENSGEIGREVLIGSGGR